MRAAGGEIWTETDPLQKAKDDYFFSKDFNKKDYEDMFGHEDLMEQGRRDVRRKDEWQESQADYDLSQRDPVAFAKKFGLQDPRLDQLGELNNSIQNNQAMAARSQETANYLSNPEKYQKTMGIIDKLGLAKNPDQRKNLQSQLNRSSSGINASELQNQIGQLENQGSDVKKGMSADYEDPLHKRATDMSNRYNQARYDMAQLQAGNRRADDGWKDRSPSFWEQAAQVADDATGNIGSSLYNMGKAWSKGDVGGGFMNLLGAGTGLISAATPVGALVNGANTLTKYAGAPKWLGDVVQTVGAAKNPMGATVNLGMQYGLPEVLKATGAVPSSPSVPAQKKGGKIPSQHVYGYRKEKPQISSNSKKTTNRTPYKRKT